MCSTSKALSVAFGVTRQTAQVVFDDGFGGTDGKTYRATLDVSRPGLPTVIDSDHSYGWKQEKHCTLSNDRLYFEMNFGSAVIELDKFPELHDLVYAVRAPARAAEQQPAFV